MRPAILRYSRLNDDQYRGTFACLYTGLSAHIAARGYSYGNWNFPREFIMQQLIEQIEAQYDTTAPNQ